MPKKNNYDINSMEAAITEVKLKRASLRAAAKKYGVPKSTLEFKIKNPGHKDTCGPSPILTAVEEEELVKWIEELVHRGFPRKKEDILSSVQKFLVENPRPNPFNNNRPGDCWFKAFLKRHPIIVQRTSEAVSAASACVSETDIRNWFKDIGNYLTSKNIVINDPSRIYNGDETGFQICPSTGKVFATKGSKNVYSVDKGSQKENITVMFAFSAAGMTCPPMIIYPYKRIPEKISQTVTDTWGIGRSDNGWMTADTFYDYIKNIFHPHLLENNITFPVVLFLDGHKSHLTYELSLLCNNLNMEVIALYPNATRVLQPCDVAVFRPIKMGWKKAVRHFYEENPDQVLNKISFAPLLFKVVNEVIKPETLKHGFKACGLFPFNADAIDYSKCLGKETKHKEVLNRTSTMDLNDFLKFVGSKLINKFKEIDTILGEENFNDEFAVLYKMWVFFGKPVKNVNEAIDLNNEKTENTEGGYDEMTNTNNGELELTETILNAAETEVDERTSKENDEAKGSEEAPEIKKEVLMKTDNAQDIPTELTKIHVLQNIKINEVNSTRQDENLPSTSKAAQEITSTSSAKSISEYLELPEKSERKNKRNIERVPFAVTSRSYQEYFEKKRALKEEEEKNKLERKRKREEAALAKKKKQMGKENSVEVKCFVCKKLIKSQHLTCDNCQKKYHHRCIPKQHKQHIPDVDDNDLFMCHMCYKEESEEEVSQETENEDNDSSGIDTETREQRIIDDMYSWTKNSENNTNNIENDINQSNKIQKVTSYENNSRYREETDDDIEIDVDESEIDDLFNNYKREHKLMFS